MLSKAIMCYIQAEDFDRAIALLADCPAEEAATQYLRYVLAVKQGDADTGESGGRPRSLSAIACVRAIVRSPNLDRKHLLLMRYVWISRLRTYTKLARNGGPTPANYPRIFIGTARLARTGAYRQAV